VNDAASEATLGQELEVGADVAGKCALPATENDRAEEEVTLIDQSCGNRLTGELSTANCDVADRGCIEPSDH
jgi:hypothetical protein